MFGLETVFEGLGVMMWLALAELIFLFAFVAFEKVGFATLSIVLFLASIHFFTPYPLGAEASAHWQQLLIAALVYIPIGVAWSFAKWFFHLKEVKQQYLDDVKKKTKSGWTQPVLIIPQASENKGRIICWIAYWPMSMVWALVHDSVEAIARNVYNMVSGVYEKITNKVFADLKQDDK